MQALDIQLWAGIAGKGMHADLDWVTNNLPWP